MRAFFLLQRRDDARKDAWQPEPCQFHTSVQNRKLPAFKPLVFRGNKSLGW